MSKSNYLPHGDKEKVTWLMTFNSAFAVVATVLGFTAAEIAAVNSDYLAAQYIYNMLETFKSELHERAMYKDLLFDGDAGVELGEIPVGPVFPAAPEPVKAGIYKRIAKVVQRIKNHPKYNDAIGKNLGIIGAEKVIDLNMAKPTISVKAVTPDSIIINFLKGTMEGVVVYSGSVLYMVPEEGATEVPGTVTEAEMVWEEVARLNHSPFIDTRINSSNKPEIRYYKMRYILNDELVGQESVIVNVVSNKFKAGSDLANKVK